MRELTSAMLLTWIDDSLASSSIETLNKRALRGCTYTVCLEAANRIAYIFSIDGLVQSRLLCKHREIRIGPKPNQKLQLKASRNNVKFERMHFLST